MRLSTIITPIFLFAAANAMANPEAEAEANLEERGMSNYCRTRFGSGSCTKNDWCKGISVSSKHDNCGWNKDCCVTINCHSQYGSGICRSVHDSCDDSRTHKAFMVYSKHCPKSTKCCVKKQRTPPKKQHWGHDDHRKNSWHDNKNDHHDNHNNHDGHRKQVVNNHGW
ncbi:hypothetical protein BZA77DRAFT_173467 [Pyronema omphalodes]|nr:hypothetical protein BZA77DRAFT_173467 [Pyronema omphalodes]